MLSWPQGPRGVKGDPGKQGLAAVTGYAEYIYTQTAGSDAATFVNPVNAFSIPTQAFNTIGITMLTSNNNDTTSSGNAFLLPIGVYQVNYETIVNNAHTEEEPPSGYLMPLALFTSSANNGTYVTNQYSRTIAQSDTWTHATSIISAIAPTYLIFAPTVDQVKLVAFDSDELPNPVLVRIIFG